MTLLGLRRGALALGLLALLATGGCGASEDANNLATQLEYEGYNNLSVRMDKDQPAGDIVVVRARGNVALSDEEAIDSLQSVIWSSLPRRFDVLDIRVGSIHNQSSYQQLSQRFGPRNPALDQQRIGTDVSTVVIAVSLAVGLVAALAALLAIAMYRRRCWEERELALRISRAQPRALPPGLPPPLALPPAAPQAKPPAYTPPPAFG